MKKPHGNDPAWVRRGLTGLALAAMVLFIALWLARSNGAGV